MSKTRLVFVEGVIGCGKTTCLNNLEEYLKTSGVSNVKVVYEPVELWQSLGLLSNFYKDKARWAYTFQNMAFITKMMLLEQLDKDYIYVIERSPHVDRHVFAELCHESGDINDQEWQLYKLWYDHYMTKFNQSFAVEFVYIQTPAALCLERATTRSRSEEVGIPLAYFQALSDKHDSWLLKDDSVVVHNVDGSQSPMDLIDDIIKLLDIN